VDIEAVAVFLGLLLIFILTGIGLVFTIRQDRAKTDGRKKSLAEALHDPAPEAKPLQRLAWIAVAGLLLIVIVGKLASCAA
jgi:hypothetical protein